MSRLGFYRSPGADPGCHVRVHIYRCVGFALLIFSFFLNIL